MRPNRLSQTRSMTAAELAHLDPAGEEGRRGGGWGRGGGVTETSGEKDK